MGRGPIPMRRPKLPFHLAITAEGTFGISPSFLGVSQSSGQVTHVLLTRSRLCPRPKPGSSLHLHVLGTPPAFVLSQDQTLREGQMASRPSACENDLAVILDGGDRSHCRLRESSGVHPRRTCDESHAVAGKPLGLSLEGSGP